LVRDLLNDLKSGTPDPMKSARHAMRSQLPKRFYKEVSLGEVEGGFFVLLDGKVAKTPARKSLMLPLKIAEIVSAEWEAQTRDIEPSKMPVTRLVNLAIDRVADEAIGIAEEIVRYAASDYVLYRATEPEGLVAVQSTFWDPIVKWVDRELGARFQLAEGISFIAQPEPALRAIRKHIKKYPLPFALAALASATQLTGSAFIALMLAHRQLDADDAWRAAHVDEDWNIQQWGNAAEAAAQRAARFTEFCAAARLLALYRNV
jgi:chaperone required for assembly of F1-ATPase